MAFGYMAAKPGTKSAQSAAPKKKVTKEDKKAAPAPAPADASKAPASKGKKPAKKNVSQKR